jgi:molecular chaperone DnaK (HSP70)
MTTSAIGVDFGTTNSSIARANHSGEIELAQFPALGSITDAYRSLLYLEQIKERGVNTLKSWTGPEGIERYLAAETKGRLIQSLKSFLSSRSLHGTEIFGRRVTLEDLIARILRDLREKAECQFGTAINSVVVGQALEPKKIAALLHLIQEDLGYHLHRAVQKVKSELSDKPAAIFRFSEGSVELTALIPRPSFEHWIADELQQIERCVDSLLLSSGVKSGDVDMVFLTGGSSFVPAVRKIFETRFGTECIRAGNEFTSVARGLALKAIELQEVIS